MSCNDPKGGAAKLDQSDPVDDVEHISVILARMENELGALGEALRRNKADQSGRAA